MVSFALVIRYLRNIVTNLNLNNYGPKSNSCWIRFQSLWQICLSYVCCYKLKSSKSILWNSQETECFQATMQLIESQTSPEVQSVIFNSLLMICKIFYSLNYQVWNNMWIIGKKIINFVWRNDLIHHVSRIYLNFSKIIWRSGWITFMFY